MDELSSPNIYSPLSVSKKEIRLLHLLPPPSPLTSVDSSETLLYATLTTVSLLQTPLPEFKALSYVWGPPPHLTSADTPRYYIHLNGGNPLPIRPNLYRYLSHHNAAPDNNNDNNNNNDARLWIDAVCINQSDIPERNSQVRLMGEVYRSAASVISWIGWEPVLVDGLKRLKEISAIWRDSRYHPRGPSPSPSVEGLRDSRSGAGSEPEMNAPSRFLEASRELWRDGAEKKLHGLFTLLLSDYWRRVWIVQEMILARRETHVYVCGRDAASDAEVEAFCECVTACFGGEKPDAVSHQVWMSMERVALWEVRMQAGFRSVRRGDARPSLMFVLQVSGTRQSTDPRDAVYGLLNVIPDHGIVPDYAKPVAEVYVDWAVKTMLAQGNMDLVSYAAPGGEQEEDVTDLDLPSWVPDLHNKKGHMNVAWWVYKEKKNDGTFSANVVDGRILKVQGRLFDRVSNVTHFRYHSDSKKNREQHPLDQDWRLDIIRFSFNYLSAQRQARKKYPTGIPPLQALVRLVFHSQILGSSLDQESRELHDLACQLITFLLFNFCITPGMGDRLPFDEAYGFAAFMLGFSVGDGDFARDYQRVVFPGIDVGESYGWTSLSDVTSEITSTSSDRRTAMMIEWRERRTVFETEQGYLGTRVDGSSIKVGDHIVDLKHSRYLLAMRDPLEERFMNMGRVDIVGFEGGGVVGIVGSSAGSDVSEESEGRKGSETEYREMLIL